jgi:hypothetical protein
MDAFSSAFFRRSPEKQFRARLCDSGQAPHRVETQVLNDLTPPFVLSHFAAHSESHYTFPLHRFRASLRDMTAPQKKMLDAIAFKKMNLSLLTPEG